MKLTENDMCANCGTIIEYWLKRGHRAYLLTNGDYHCSKKCIKETCGEIFCIEKMIRHSRWNYQGKEGA